MVLNLKNLKEKFIHCFYIRYIFLYTLYSTVVSLLTPLLHHPSALSLIPWKETFSFSLFIDFILKWKWNEGEEKKKKNIQAYPNPKPI